MATFVTGKKLTDAVYDIIYNARKELLIVSPFIKLDDYFKKEVFKEHVSNSSLRIFVVFGKNQDRPDKRINQTDLDFFRNFPDISLTYVPDLHAKYYANESSGVITSINLYDTSFRKNEEFGVLSSGSLITGASQIEIDAWNATMDLLEDHPAILVRRPKFKKKLIGKDYMGSEDIIDQIDKLVKGERLENISVLEHLEDKFIEKKSRGARKSREEFEADGETDSTQENTQQAQFEKGANLLSATALGNKIGLSYSDVVLGLSHLGYITEDGKGLLAKGEQAGIQRKYGKDGTSWLVYPDDILTVSDTGA